MFEYFFASHVKGILRCIGNYYMYYLFICLCHVIYISLKCTGCPTKRFTLNFFEISRHVFLFLQKSYLFLKTFLTFIILSHREWFNILVQNVFCKDSSQLLSCLQLCSKIGRNCLINVLSLLWKWAQTGQCKAPKRHTCLAALSDQTVSSKTIVFS